MKLSKKILAGVLAAIMAISMMPSIAMTALADEAVDVTKLATPSFTATPYHQGAVTTDAYSNVVYSPIWTTSWSGQGNDQNTYVGVGRINFKVAAPLNIVLVYDGAHDVIAPVVMESVCNDTGGSSHIIHFAECQSSLFELRQQWNGYGRTWDLWPSDNIETADKFSYNQTDGNESSDSQRDSNTRFWWNKLYYKGSGNTDSYYEVDKNISYYARTSYKTTTGRQNKYGTITSYTNNYVINYKPIYDILSNARTIAAEINANGWKYTDTSLSQAVNALNAVGNCNPNNYDYSSDVAGTVAQCATDIKNAKAAYDAINLVKKTFTVDFKTSDGSSTIDSRSITAGDALGTLPANSAVAPTDGTHHNVYTWEGVSADTVVQSDTTYSETATATACTFTAGTHTAATAESNGYTTYTCDCGNSYVEYDALDFANYNTAVADYNETINAADYETTYTADSRTAYETAVEAAKLTAAQLADETLSPTVISNAVAAITAAKSQLVEEETPENSYNLTLEENIDVNFNLDTDFYENNDATTVTCSYITTTDDKSAARAEAEMTFADVKNAQGTITMNAAPAQIAEKYIITVKDSNNEVVDTIEASVQDYCKAIIDAPISATITQKDKDVAQALINYGALANEYFGYAETSEAVTGEAYAVEHSEDYKDAVDAESFKAKAKASMVVGVDRSGKPLTITGVSYVALLDPELRFYVSQENEVWCYYTELSISDPSLSAEWVKTENGNCVRVTGLKASDFAKTFTITIGTTEITYNGYAFLYTVLKDGSTADNNLKDLAKGIYRYAAACEAKFA
ncbi:MAG: FIVAR domain-containing protein [Eubacterium sp.]|nr:FIVAR domain-containing protein [Eubacterium sp.]